MNTVATSWLRMNWGVTMTKVGPYPCTRICVQNVEWGFSFLCSLEVSRGGKNANSKQWLRLLRAFCGPYPRSRVSDMHMHGVAAMQMHRQSETEWAVNPCIPGGSLGSKLHFKLSACAVNPGRYGGVLFVDRVLSYA